MHECSGEIARRLAERALEVCRRYLPKGKRVGDYWIVGDVRGAKGRSLYVRLAGPSYGQGAAGHWTDAATAEYGDFLDVIAAACRFTDHRDALDEAHRFLGQSGDGRRDEPRTGRARSSGPAQRLFAASKPIAGTLAEAYLQSRGVADSHDLESLRFHPRCFYRADDKSPRRHFPAMIAAITDCNGALTGVQRTYLARGGSGKAKVASPRKALGGIAGNAVRFGAVDDVMIVGEGIETVLSLKGLMPLMSMAAALSATNLSALTLPTTLNRLYIASDRDEPGKHAAEHLRRRADEIGIAASILMPAMNDFNDDLMCLRPAALIASLSRQLAPQDRAHLCKA